MVTATVSTVGSRSRSRARRIPPLARLSAALGAIAVAVSAIGSWIPSLWGDEAASVLSATRPLGTLWPMLAHVDAVHGAYYVGLHVWIDVFGSSAFSVRLPSACAIGMAVAAVTWLCGRFGSLRFAALAGVIAMLLPRMTYAGEEARAYAFDAAIATVLCVVLVELALHGRSSRRGWIAYAAVLTVGIYAFVYFALMIPVAAVVVTATPVLRRQWRRWMLATTAAVVASAPVLVLALLERRQVAFLAHRDVVTPDAVLVQMWFGSLPFAVVAWALVGIGVVGWIVDVVRQRRRREPWEPGLELIATAWLILPMGMLIGASPWVAGYTARYGTLAAPAAAILLSVGLRRLARRRVIAAVLLASVIVAGASEWATQRTPYAKNGSDWNDIAATVRSHATEGDAIVFDESVRPSRRPRLAMNTDPAAFEGLGDPTLKIALADGVSWHDTAYRVADAVRLGRFAGVERVWVVEYASGGADDTWGIAELQAAGYHVVERFPGHHSVVLLVTK